MRRRVRRCARRSRQGCPAEQPDRHRRPARARLHPRARALPRRQGRGHAGDQVLRGLPARGRQAQLRRDRVRHRADPAGRLRAHRRHGPPARPRPARLRRGGREGRRAPPSGSAGPAHARARARPQRARRGRRRGQRRGARTALGGARERHRAGRRGARGLVPQGAAARVGGRRRARLLAAADLAPRGGDPGRPRRQRAGRVRDPDRLLRARRAELRADDVRRSRCR